jgi:hypothetical protein
MTERREEGWAGAKCGKGRGGEEVKDEGLLLGQRLPGSFCLNFYTNIFSFQWLERLNFDY